MNTNNILILVLLSMLLGCYKEEAADIEGNPGFDDHAVGPCVITPREHVIKILSAVDQVTEDDIESITISDIHYHNEQVVFFEIIDETVENIEINSIEKNLICSLPCAIFNQEGSYSFTVEALGYDDKVVEIDAGYAVFEGGCPGYVDVGTEIHLKLSGS